MDPTDFPEELYSVLRSPSSVYRIMENTELLKGICHLLQTPTEDNVVNSDRTVKALLALLSSSQGHLNIIVASIVPALLLHTLRHFAKGDRPAVAAASLLIHCHRKVNDLFPSGIEGALPLPSSLPHAKEVLFPATFSRLNVTHISGSNMPCVTLTVLGASILSMKNAVELHSSHPSSCSIILDSWLSLVESSEYRCMCLPSPQISAQVVCLFQVERDCLQKVKQMPGSSGMLKRLNDVMKLYSDAYVADLHKPHCAVLHLTLKELL